MIGWKVGKAYRCRHGGKAVFMGWNFCGLPCFLHPDLPFRKVAHTKSGKLMCLTDGDAGCFRPYDLVESES